MEVEVEVEGALCLHNCKKDQTKLLSYQEDKTFYINGYILYNKNVTDVDEMIYTIMDHA